MNDFDEVRRYEVEMFEGGASFVSISQDHSEEFRLFGVTNFRSDITSLEMNRRIQTYHQISCCRICSLLLESLGRIASYHNEAKLSRDIFHEACL